MITITHSPCESDETPFSYEAEAFIGWVESVFMESYKRDITPLTLDQAIQTVEGAGYKLQYKCGYCDDVIEVADECPNCDEACSARNLTVKNLVLVFDADQVTRGDDRAQALEAIHKINLLLQKDSELNAQILSSHLDNSDVESSE